MAESGRLPSWVEAWVGKVVQVHVHGDSDPLFGVLEDWDRRGLLFSPWCAHLLHRPLLPDPPSRENPRGQPFTP
jgi:hypothetical protein